MGRLDNLKDRKAIELLNQYEGKNPYIKKLKRKLINDKKILLTGNQIKYIIDNHDKLPIHVNKIINITEYLGEELKKNENLSFIPSKMLFGYILAETDKTYHVYGKLKRNQDKLGMYFIPKTQILEDPLHNEVNIEVDFDKYQELDQFELSDGTIGRTPYEHQKDGIKFLLANDGCLLADDMGLGKAEFVENQVFTPKGRQKIGTIKPGDYVIGSNGKPTLVEDIYPQGVKDLYRVTFNDGYSVLVCKEHLFTVTSNNGSVNNKNRPVRYTTLSVEQMLDEHLELKQIGTGWNEKRPYKFKSYYKQSNGQNKWQIPIVKPIEFENENELSIEPYLLGLILGDGCIQNNYAGFVSHKDDFDEILGGYLITEHKSVDNVRRCRIDLGESIGELNLSKTRSDNKFIPDIYKYSTIEDRLAILQGLMDTDGHCMKSDKGVFVGTEYCTVSEQLADDVAEIVHSLGGIVRKKSKIGSYKKEDGTKVICKKAYRLNIKLPEGMNPFRLKRKANEYNPPQKYKVGRYIKDIKLEKQGEAVCIQVSADNHLYVTEHGIVTHNTYQSIIAALESGVEKILIVCPSAVKINWEREINSFQEYDTAIIDGKKWKDAKFTIINYDILKNFHTIPGVTDKKLKEEDLCMDAQILVKAQFDLCILDEAHKIKDPKSNRGAIMKDLCVNYGIDKVWLLSGTPVANRPMDYYNLLKIIKSPIADNYKFFVQRYCDGKLITTKHKNKSGSQKRVWLTNGATNLEELAIKTKNIYLRRLKTELNDMPDKTIVPTYHRFNKRQREGYEGLWEDYLEKRRLDNKKGVPDKELVELGLLRKFVAMEAIPKTIEMVDNIIEQDKKVIIFTNFTDELIQLKEHFKGKCVVHYGGLTDKEKQYNIDTFQKDDNVKIFIGNIISAGVGITLTEATEVIFNSFDWVPGNNEQAEDRSYRIGQKNNVTVYYQLFDMSVSTTMWNTVRKKRDVIDIIMGQTDVNEDNIVSKMLDEIIKNEENEES